MAAECRQDNFGSWLEQSKQQAIGLGISQQSATSALNGITYDPVIVARDHSQSVFQQSFEQFSGRMASPDRLRKGANMLKRYGSIWLFRAGDLRPSNSAKTRRAGSRTTSPSCRNWCASECQ